MPATHQKPFWDRGIDQEGRVIRTDVRCAAHDIWEKSCQMAGSVLGNEADAAEILESCVARVSRYMNERNQGIFTQSTNALLLVAFRNVLFSLAQKRRRMLSIEDAKAIERQRRNLTWEQEMALRLDLKKLVRQLSPRSRAILALRNAGYEWPEVSALLGVTAANAKSSFWREIRQLRSKIAKAPPTRIQNPAAQCGRKSPQKTAEAVSSESTSEVSDPTTDVALLFSSRSPPRQFCEESPKEAADVKEDQSRQIVGAKARSLRFPNRWFREHDVLLK